MTASEENCLLCGSVRTQELYRDRTRFYLKCEDCSLTFVPTRLHVNAAEERARYDLHENSPEDDGYLAFLGRIADPIAERYDVGSSCLEFGCGPSPVLAQLLEKRGFSVTAYDPFYRPDAMIKGPYDVITATEVLEHLRRPLEELDRLVALLKDGGTLAVMTGIRDDSNEFGDWHYKNDKTHICFFDWNTFEWIGNRFSLDVTRIAKDIVFLRKDGANED